MRSQDLSNEEIGRLGLDLYRTRLRAILEPAQDGRFVAISVEDGDYEVADTSLDADLRLRTRHPEAVFYTCRVGHEFVTIFSTPYYDERIGKH